jgi:hypothetical protein
VAALGEPFGRLLAEADAAQIVSKAAGRGQNRAHLHIGASGQFEFAPLQAMIRFAVNLGRRAFRGHGAAAAAPAGGAHQVAAHQRIQQRARSARDLAPVADHWRLAFELVVGEINPRGGESLERWFKAVAPDLRRQILPGASRDPEHFVIGMLGIRKDDAARQVEKMFLAALHLPLQYGQRVRRRRRLPQEVPGAQRHARVINDFADHCCALLHGTKRCSST